MLRRLGVVLLRRVEGGKRWLLLCLVREGGERGRGLDVLRLERGNVLRYVVLRRHFLGKHILLPGQRMVRLHVGLLLVQVVLVGLAVRMVGLRVEGVLRGRRGLPVVVHALVEVLDEGLGLHEALELLVEALVDLGEVEFALAVGHVLQVDVVVVRHRVGGLKDLVLLQVHLKGGLVWEVNEALLELDELLDTAEASLNPEERLVNGALNGQ